VLDFKSDRDRIRTYDRLLRRQMLYPAELRDRILYFVKVQKKIIFSFSGANIQLSHNTIQLNPKKIIL
jgi:hypothetical protein